MREKKNESKREKNQEKEIARVRISESRWATGARNQDQWWARDAWRRGGLHLYALNLGTGPNAHLEYRFPPDFRGTSSSKLLDQFHQKQSPQKSFKAHMCVQTTK